MMHRIAATGVLLLLLLYTTSGAKHHAGREEKAKVAHRPSIAGQVNAKMPPPDRALREADPSVGYRYFPNFVPQELRSIISEYSDRWTELQREKEKKKKKKRLVQGRMNGGSWEPEFAQRMWDGLIGQDPERLEMLRLPSRPGWRAVGFTSYVLPCVYLDEGARFHNHVDHPVHHDEATGEWLPADFESRDPDRPVNWGKLVLYPEPFEGGELVFYDRDEYKEARLTKLRKARKGGEPRVRAPQPKELARLDLEAGSAVLFDMWYPHASLPLRNECKRKIAMGLRVMYVRDERG